MSKRTLLTVLLVFVIAATFFLVVFLYVMLNTGSGDNAGVTAADVRQAMTKTVDPFANRADDAVKLVRETKVLDPEYLEEFLAAKKAFIENRGRVKDNNVDPSSISPRFTTIEKLVDKGYLENKFGMSFLKRGNWSAMHLDTDWENEVYDDPHYEVYLSYIDGAVEIGPVWIVDVEAKTVVPRNEMAELFDRDLKTYEQIDDILQKPARVVNAIISHKFDSGIALGGVFLLHFLKKAQLKGHEKDSIVGWTVSHEFKDVYDAYFQWVELGEPRYAKFRFHFDSQTLEPKGLIAIDLMAEGDNFKLRHPVDIWPEGYTNNLRIPRRARWKSGTPCAGGDYAQLCSAFIKVLEQEDFVQAMQWLLTGSSEKSAEMFKECKEARQCKWNLKAAEGELNPDKNTNLFLIGYRYDLGQGAKSIDFLVDSEKETIQPLDELSRWAYWSVTPRN